MLSNSSNNTVIFAFSNCLSVGFYPGAMLVICDVNEYRKCVKEFNVPLVSQLFEKLHALCNLLAVVPENLKDVCGGEQLVSQ